MVCKIKAHIFLSLVSFCCDENKKLEKIYIGELVSKKTQQSNKINSLNTHTHRRPHCTCVYIRNKSVKISEFNLIQC